MDRPTSSVREQQVRRQLNEEQEKYVQCITTGKNQENIQKIRDRITTLQKQLNSLAGGYHGL